MRFADITGQEDLKRHLVQSVDAGRVSHAQLFTGQAGAGALALATIAMTAIRAVSVPTAVSNDPAPTEIYTWFSRSTSRGRNPAR